MKDEIKELKVFYEHLVGRLKVDGCAIPNPAKVLKSAGEDTLKCIIEIEHLEAMRKADANDIYEQAKYQKKLETEIMQWKEKAKRDMWHIKELQRAIASKEAI